jgi:hypothetical protein
VVEAAESDPGGGRLAACRERAPATTYSRLKIGAGDSPLWRYADRSWMSKLLPMPLEGHYRRVNTPLRKLTTRERAVLAVGIAITAIAVAALLFVPSHNDRPLLDEHGGRRAGCIEVAVAGRVGSEPIVGCGERAVALCRRATGFEGPRPDAILAACTEAGVKF